MVVCSLYVRIAIIHAPFIGVCLKVRMPIGLREWWLFSCQVGEW